PTNSPARPHCPPSRPVSRASPILPPPTMASRTVIKEGYRRSKTLWRDLLDPWSRAAGRVWDADSQGHPDASGVVGVVLLENDSRRVDRLADEVLGLRPVHEVGDVEVLAEEHLVVDCLPAD